MENSLTGQEINGYRIGPLLGVGGMGEVYQAFAANSDTPVAIKFLRTDYMDDSHFQARFIREIRIMQALKHDNIVPILDHGLVGGRQLYYTMRLISGQSLSTMMRRQKISPQAYDPILAQVCAALGFGHANNVVHRDIKPDNIFMERDAAGKLKVFLGDFGLGKREGMDNTLTEAGAAVGTPHYMSPEAIMGERPTPQSDIYSIGVLSYEVLLGKLPFTEPQPHKVAIAHVTKPVPRPSVLHPGFPPDLEDVLLKSLEKVPTARYESIEEFYQAYQMALDAMTEAEANTIYAVDV